MRISISKSSYNPIDSIENFWNTYYSMQKHYLVSDLLDYGLSPNQILKAVFKAITAAKSSRTEIHKHFLPVFSQRNHDIITDCKRSQMGYGLILLYADVALSLVGQLQVSIMKSFLK